VDLDEIARNFAYLFLEEDGSGGDPPVRDQVSAEVDFSGMTKTYSGTKWTGLDQNRKRLSNIIWSSVYVNPSKQPMAFDMNTERSTESYFTMEFTRACHIKGGLDLQLTPPFENSGLVLQSGFTSRRATTRNLRDTVRVPMTWALRDSVVVGAGRELQATMVVLEDVLEGEFQDTVTFDGRVSVVFTDRKTGEEQGSVTENVREVFTARDGFGQDDCGRPYFTLRGTCHGRLGSEQVVTLTEGKARRQTVPALVMC